MLQGLMGRAMSLVTDRRDSQLQPLISQEEEEASQQSIEVYDPDAKKQREHDDDSEETDDEEETLGKGILSNLQSFGKALADVAKFGGEEVQLVKTLPSNARCGVNNHFDVNELFRVLQQGGYQM